MTMMIIVIAAAATATTTTTTTPFFTLFVVSRASDNTTSQNIGGGRMHGPSPTSNLKKSTLSPRAGLFTSVAWSDDVQRVLHARATSGRIRGGRVAEDEACYIFEQPVGYYVLFYAHQVITQMLNQNATSLSHNQGPVCTGPET